jgi:hypothetical protein
VTCVYGLVVVAILLGIVGAVGFFVLWPDLKDFTDISDFDGD